MDYSVDLSGFILDSIIVIVAWLLLAASFHFNLPSTPEPDYRLELRGTSLEDGFRIKSNY